MHVLKLGRCRLARAPSFVANTQQGLLMLIIRIRVSRGAKARRAYVQREGRKQDVEQKQAAPLITATCRSDSPLFNQHFGEGDPHESEKQQSAPQECPAGTTGSHFTRRCATCSHIILATAVAPDWRGKRRCRRGGGYSLRFWRCSLRAGGGSDRGRPRLAARGRGDCHGAGREEIGRQL